MVIHFPENGEEGPPFCAAVLYFVGEVNFKITWIPDPGLGPGFTYKGTKDTKEHEGLHAKTHRRRKEVKNG
jgi:hypothetical protein